MASDAEALVHELRDVLARAMRVTTELAAAEPACSPEQHEQEEENRRLAEQNVELESQMHRVTTLWVAATRLHQSLVLEEVIEALREILIGLIGSEEFAVLLYDSSAREFVPVACEGEPGLVGLFHELDSEAGAALGKDAVTTWTGDAPSRGLPLIAIPLRLGVCTIGGILVFKLFDHKESFTTLDEELFDLLARQAATALHAAQLHFDSQRKLATLQGVIDEFIAQDPGARSTARTRARSGGPS